MTARSRILVGVTVLVLVAGAAVAGCVSASWQSKVEQDHPLVGRIWDVRREAFVGAITVVDRLSQVRFVLLGEKHDNADHHRLQASVLRQLIVAGRRPAVAFEMFTADQAPAIQKHLAAHPRDAATLGDAVDWKKSGWPDWSLYAPIAQAALDADLPILAANLPRATLASLRRDGAQGLDATFASRHQLDRAASADVEQAMTEEIREAHCGHAPAAMVPRMILIQRARDAAMAERLLEGATRDGAMLIAGDGHVRLDRGVPAYLRHVNPTATIAVVAFVEVRKDATAPQAYGRTSAIPSFDYVWFTPRVDDQDPCETFRKSLERMRAPQGSPTK
jgi:uncharacterized iron-regulated protein